MIQHRPSATAPARMAAAILRSCAISFHRIERREPDHQGEGDDENHDAEPGEDQAVQDREYRS